MENLTIAVVDNTMNSTYVEEVGRQLEEAHGATIRKFRKPAHNHPAPQSMIDDIAACDVAVLGVGTCGSCTSSTVVDAAVLEKRGIPTVTIVWDTFAGAAKTAARIKGVPGVKLLVVPQRTGAEGPEVEIDKARSYMGELKTLILSN
jgi:hypothetical protein